MLTLVLKTPPNVPLEAECISPDVFAPLTLDQIRAQPVFLGKRHEQLGTFFDVHGEPGETIEFRGDTTRVKWIGKGMTRGRISVVGNVGMHLGAYMRGGVIEVHGNAADWVGGEMAGGLIHVRGNAGGQIGAAYRGSVSGMNRGTILIEGDAGMEIGMRMKRGIIAVKGRVKDFSGLQMNGGTIFLLGGAEIRTGAWMNRGTIVSMKPIPLLPTFAGGCVYRPTFLNMYAKYLGSFGFAVPTAGPYVRYNGDSSGAGKGEILILQQS